MWPELIARDVNDLPRVDIGPTAEGGCCVEKNHRFSDSAGASEDNETISHWTGGDVEKDIGAVTEIALSAVPEQSM